MKKIILLITAFNLFTSGFSQPKTSKGVLRSKIIALEKAGWEAWKNKDIRWFQKNTTEECLWITSNGISKKSEMIKSTTSDCNVKSVSIDSFQFVKLNDKTILLTYIASQDGYCGNKKLSNKVRASVNYVNRGGKWLEAFYMETPIND